MSTETIENPLPEGSLFGDAEVIHRYTRADAVRDGVLVDVSTLATEAGIRWPVALTAAAHADAAAWTDADDARKRTFTGQSTDGRLWDVLFLARLTLAGAARRESRDHAFSFDVLRVPTTGRGTLARRVTLRLVVDGGDDGAPVVTISLPHES